MSPNPRTEAQDRPSQRRSIVSRVAGFFHSRRRGETPLATLFWRDMLTVGSIVNAVTTLAAVGALAADWPIAAAIGIHLLPLPYNIFLFACVWRAAARAGTGLAYAAQIVAVLWVVLAIAL